MDVDNRLVRNTMTLEQYITEAISTGKHTKKYDEEFYDLKVGDRVRVKSKKEILDIPGVEETKYGDYMIKDYTRPSGMKRDFYINPRMFDYCGKEFTVGDIDEHNGHVKLKEIRSKWVWIIEMLEIL
jgi:hypothetical protein